jgi:hypothetical protein
MSYLVLLLLFIASAAADCHPLCHWTCSDPPCRPTVVSICQSVNCSYSCAAPNDTITCDAPTCTMLCPADQCELDSCPVCEIQCEELQCSSTTDETINCTTHCAEPQCDWHATAPRHCTAPTCELACEAPACEGQASDASSRVDLLNIILLQCIVTFLHMGRRKWL